MALPDPMTPGQLIRQLLDERGWTQKVLATVLSTTEQAINLVILDKRDLSADMAISLGDVFGIPPERFMDLQKAKELHQARGRVRTDPGLARRASLYGALPIGEMIKRGWIHADDVKQVHKVESELARFFGVESTDAILVLPHAAKKTNAEDPDSVIQSAWFFRVKQIAKEMVVPRYSPEAVRGAIEELSALLLSPEAARHIPRILAQAGIRFLLVESLPKAKIDGVCLWLDKASPVIGMSMRYDRIDNFWFVLRHELEHVLRLHGQERPVIDTDLESGGLGLSEEERVANEAALAFCVTQKDLDSFIARKQPIFAERDILGFAARLRIHPGLVAGQLRYRLKRWELFSKHLVKIRFAIAPSAVVDGWGDVYPVGSDEVKA